VSLTPFHIAFLVDDLDTARTFCGTTLGRPEGRSSAQWIDFDLFGHQIVAHLKTFSTNGKAHHNPCRRP
jgi:extradiol dioxygenase family protein